MIEKEAGWREREREGGRRRRKREKTRQDKILSLSGLGSITTGVNIQTISILTESLIRLSFVF